MVRNAFSIFPYGRIYNKSDLKSKLYSCATWNNVLIFFIQKNARCTLCKMVEANDFIMCCPLIIVYSHSLHCIKYFSLFPTISIIDRLIGPVVSMPDN